MTGQTVERASLSAVAGQTPPHFEGRGPGRIRHIFHVTIAVHAFHPMVKMHLVREIDEIRKALESDPLNRRLVFPIRQKLLGFRCFFLEVLMASHAELQGRDTGDGRYASVTMAKETGHFQLPGMKFVAEPDRLDVLLRTVCRPAGIEQSYDERDSAEGEDDEYRRACRSPCEGCGCHRARRRTSLQSD